MTPGTTSAAPWSPPIASKATRTMGSAVGVAAAAAHRLRRHGQPALVVAAVRADAVRQLHLVAVRTLLEVGQVDREMRASLALAGMRDASLGYTHGVSWAPCRSGGERSGDGARGRERGSRRRRSLPRNGWGRQPSGSGGRSWTGLDPSRPASLSLHVSRLAAERPTSGCPAAPWNMARSK